MYLSKSFLDKTCALPRIPKINKQNKTNKLTIFYFSKIFYLYLSFIFYTGNLYMEMKIRLNPDNKQK